MNRKIRSNPTIVPAIAALVLTTGCATDPDEPPPADSLDLPEIQQAIEVQESLQEQQTMLCSLNSEIDTCLTDAVNCVPHSPSDDTASWVPTESTHIDRLLEMTRQLRKTAHEILDHRDEYLQAVRKYLKTVNDAPEKLREAARLFETFADEEPYQALREDYLVMSQMFTSLAERYTSLRYDLKAEFNEEDFNDTMDYLERGALMLDRFEAALTIGRQSNELAEYSECVTKLREYVETFENFRQEVRNVNELLKKVEVEPAATESPSCHHQPESAATVSPIA